MEESLREADALSLPYDPLGAGPLGYYLSLDTNKESEPKEAGATQSML